MISPRRPANCLRAQTNLMADFNHNLAGGKWDHFMDQPYIGYTSWSEPRQGNNLGAVRLREIQVPDAAAMGVAVEGSQMAVTNGEISLPQFDSFNRQRHYVDVFNRGKTPFDFSAQGERTVDSLRNPDRWINLAGNS